MIVAIEGADQAGKMTQSRLLQRALRRHGISSRLFSFPDYATPIGREIRRYLAGRKRLPPQAIHCLLAANRWERLDHIVSAQKRYDVVIMNRYYHSNIVYGVARGLDEGWLRGLDAGLPEAGLVIVLDVTRQESFRRQGAGRDRFERDGRLLEKISATYRRMARKNGWRMIDASGERRDIGRQILEMTMERVK